MGCDGRGILSPSNEVCGKVMFSEASVILSTGGGGLPSGEKLPLDRDPPMAATEVSGTHSTGMHTC